MNPTNPKSEMKTDSDITPVFLSIRSHFLNATILSQTSEHQAMGCSEVASARKGGLELHKSHALNISIFFLDSLWAWYLSWLFWRRCERSSLNFA